jgi:hypothetical protein
MKAIRRPGRWMQQLDERILEHLKEEGWATPRTMARDARFQDMRASEARIRERCRILLSRELIEPVHGDYYDISRWGLAYLRGDLDANYLGHY